MFRPEESPHFPTLEAAVLAFWKDRGIYQKSLDRRAAAPPFVFYEGPPTANGLPHPGHCLTRAIKDLFPRYRTMRGFRCERKAGWDTHGLPVEVEVCKELGIHSKEEIERFGVEPFIHRCLESVFRYTQQWERLTERLGFWIRLDEAYVTYHQSYIESVWWALKDLFDRGLLYQGHKIVWWWAQGGTALSSGEVGQGYREVADPSVYVRFPLLDEEGEPTDTDLLVWTTTPWTLPSNQFAAVHPELEYATVAVEGEDRKLVIASALVETIAGKAGKKLTVEATCRGAELIGRRYVPPFDYYFKTQGTAKGKLASSRLEHRAWRIVPADFVTTDSGTGIVHQAPAFGEVDFDVLRQEADRFVAGEGPELICAVAPDGKFTEEAPDYAGRWVKDCDKDITRDLKRRGLLFHQEQYLHEYPFCWRAEEDPLIQYPRRSWFIRTSRFKEAMLANNQRVNWLPEHIRDGRFGNFLETNVDWALSRERYWGTPLPIWVCEQTGRMEAVASYAELLEKPGLSGTEAWEQAKAANPALSDHLRVHKPYIDAVTYDSPHAQGARMRRVPEVIDCWFDSGAMPFAQWGYPHQGKERFAGQFPADFISEALDQTRGWFYSLLAISTLLFGEEALAAGDSAGSGGATDRAPVAYPHPYRSCIVLGLMLAEWWESKDGKKIYLSEEEAQAGEGNGGFVHRVGKMSKQKRNYREPNEIFDRYGADALRWYFFANQAPWTSIRYSEQAIKDSIPEFLLRLWNVYSFFVIYANIQGFNPAALLPQQGGLAGNDRGLAPRRSQAGQTKAEDHRGLAPRRSQAGQTKAEDHRGLAPRRSHDAGQLDADTLARAEGYRPVAERSELDRWIMSELARTAAAATERMDAYDNFAAAGRLVEFVDALSNWYLRRSRMRFSASDETVDKRDAYWTLYECLLTTARLIAPFTPFLAEHMWQNLARTPFGDRAEESVHLCDYPTGGAGDQLLSRRMEVVRCIVSLGRNARTNAKLKVRQPLSRVEIIPADATHRPWLEEHCGLIQEELNVRAVEFTTEAAEYVAYTVLPDLKKLGPKLGKRLPAFRKQLEGEDPAALLARLEQAGEVTLSLADGPVTLTRDDLQVRLAAKPGWAAAHGPCGVVVLATELTPDLIAEGLARDFVHAVQVRRKDLALAYTDRIAIGVVTDDAPLRAALTQFGDYIAGETLADSLVFEPLAGTEPVEINVSAAARLYVRRVEWAA